jgi:hypothetical protein
MLHAAAGTQTRVPAPSVWGTVAGFQEEMSMVVVELDRLQHTGVKSL